MMWEYTVDAAACRVLRGEEEMHLTRKEYDLLLLFLRNRGRALYRWRHRRGSHPFQRDAGYGLDLADHVPAGGPGRTGERAT